MSNSPNHWIGRKGQIPDVIVCHVTEGGFNGAVEWLCNPKSSASANAVVGANGQKDKIVDFRNGAWCNGDVKNPTAIIIKERAGINPNNYTYSIEHEGYSYKERKGALTEPQYQESLQVMKDFIVDLKNTWGVDFIIDRNHIIGHYEINSVDKINCPAPRGINFPFDRFITDLKTWRQPKLVIEDIFNKKVRLKVDTSLWDLSFTSYENAKSVKQFKAGDIIEVSAIARHSIGSSYYLTEYSFANKINNGFNIADCEDYIEPIIEPPKEPVLEPIEEDSPIIPIEGEKPQEQTGIEIKTNWLSEIIKAIFKYLKEHYKGGIFK